MYCRRVPRFPDAMDSSPAPYRAAEANNHGSVVSGGEMIRFPQAEKGEQTEKTEKGAMIFYDI